MRKSHPVRIFSEALVGALAAIALAATLAGATNTGTVPAAAAAREPVDLVYISESSGWGVAAFLARHVRQDRGVKVRVHDEWEGNLMAVNILFRLRTPGHPWIRLIRNAEIVVVHGGPVGLGIKTVERGDCVVAGCQRPLEPAPRAWQPYVATLKAIYARIFEIRKGKPVILRTANWYVPIISHAPTCTGFPPVSLEECGLVDECAKWYASWDAAISKAAAAYRVPVADVHTAFNGADHRGDPVAKGYIQADGIHPSDKGREVIARTLAQLGYAQVKAPR